jgi:porin
VPGWTIQPDFQYIFHPGRHIANPFDPTGAAIPNAAVVGVRTTINY